MNIRTNICLNWLDIFSDNLKMEKKPCWTLKKTCYFFSNSSSGMVIYPYLNRNQYISQWGITPDHIAGTKVVCFKLKWCEAASLHIHVQHFCSVSLAHCEHLASPPPPNSAQHHHRGGATGEQVSQQKNNGSTDLVWKRQMTSSNLFSVNVKTLLQLMVKSLPPLPMASESVASKHTIKAPEASTPEWTLMQTEDAVDEEQIGL